jgi:hypothetical protein
MALHWIATGVRAQGPSTAPHASPSDGGSCRRAGRERSAVAVEGVAEDGVDGGGVVLLEVAGGRHRRL